MSVNIAYYRIGKGIHTIAGKVNGLIVVIVERRLIRIGSEFKDVGR